MILLLLAVGGRRLIAQTDWGTHWFTLPSRDAVAQRCLILYGLAAPVLPVWLLLAPRDYLSTFMEGRDHRTVCPGIPLARPIMKSARDLPIRLERCRSGVRRFVVPFLFITIACGALSGFHSLISSGTTLKLLAESQMRVIGYGGMLTESFVAMMALITAAILDQHLYFAINAPAAATGGTPETAATYVNGLGLSGPAATASQIADAAASVEEHSIVSRTGGAPPWRSACLMSSPRRSAAPHSKPSGITSRSCSRRCSS